MQNWEEHEENHERFVKSCLDELVTRHADGRGGPLSTGVQPAVVQQVMGSVSYLPIQNVEKMRLRMSSAVVAPVMASMGPSAL
jgi:hypothetical protein